MYNSFQNVIFLFSTGQTPVREIKRQLELQAASPNNLNSPDAELPPLSPVSVRQMVHSYQNRLRKKSWWVQIVKIVMDRVPETQVLGFGSTK